MKKFRKLLFVLCVMVMCLLIVTPVSAAEKISNKSIVLIKGQSRTLKVTGTKGKVSWSTSKKAVAAVTAKGKVTAKNKGNAVITAKVGKRKYTCKVKVETPEISSGKITMTEGQSKLLKMSGTTQKVTWSSNKKKIAEVSQKGVVTARSVGTAKITAKVGGKKYICTVTVGKRAQITTDKPNSVQYKSYKMQSGVIVIAKNNYSYPVQIDMDCLFYNSAGTLIDKRTDNEYALEAHRECALFASNNSSTWSKYKIDMKVKKAENLVFNAGKISYSSNYGNESVMVQVKNLGQRVSFTKIAIVFYKNNVPMGYDSTFADVGNAGSTDTLQFSFLYNSWNYGNYANVVPDSYKIYVNSSYGYKWP